MNGPLTLTDFVDVSYVELEYRVVPCFTNLPNFWARYEFLSNPSTECDNDGFFLTCGDWGLWGKVCWFILCLCFFSSFFFSLWRGDQINDHCGSGLRPLAYKAVHTLTSRWHPHLTEKCVVAELSKNVTAMNSACHIPHWKLMTHTGYSTVSIHISLVAWTHMTWTAIKSLAHWVWSYIKNCPEVNIHVCVKYPAAKIFLQWIIPSKM